MPALRPFVAADLQPMLTLRHLTQIMEGLPHWDTVRAAYSQPGAVSCERHNNASDMGGSSSTNLINGGQTYKCRGIYLGNTIFAPVLGSAKLHVLRQLHDIHRCINLIGRTELSLGHAYDRIVHTRLEFVWLRPHPPLSLLEQHAVWIPSGEDYYGGLNDRHAVLSRAAAEVYMRRWDLIVDGSIMKIDPQLRAGAVTNGISFQDENLVARLRQHIQFPLRRFPAVAFLGCCAKSGLETGTAGAGAIGGGGGGGGAGTSAGPLAAAAAAR